VLASVEDEDDSLDVEDESDDEDERDDELDVSL